MHSLNSERWGCACNSTDCAEWGCLNAIPKEGRLKALLERAHSHEMTSEEKRAQRISFMIGMMDHDRVKDIPREELVVRCERALAELGM